MVRLKHRYLLINILYPEPTAVTKTASDVPDVVQFHQPTSDKLTAALLARTIRDGVAELFGDYGSGMVAGSLVATSTAIVRVSRAHYRLVWAALSYVTRLPRPLDTPCVIQVVRVSGTIRKSEEEAIRRAKASILRAHRAGRADDLLNNLLGGTVEGAAGEGAQRGIEDQDIDYDEDDDE
ncbi:RNA-binding protein pop5 [Zalaria obscura]|uniref:RNA-binding protein pop5 n=1 Tax=Zalaria obscura TaxID=2024903 RepID=A0ACC3SNK4_9PEZI